MRSGQEGMRVRWKAAWESRAGVPAPWRPAPPILQLNTKPFRTPCAWPAPLTPEPAPGPLHLAHASFGQTHVLPPPAPLLPGTPSLPSLITSNLLTAPLPPASCASSSTSSTCRLRLSSYPLPSPPHARPQWSIAVSFHCGNFLLLEPKTDMSTTPARPSSVQGASACVFRLV